MISERGNKRSYTIFPACYLNPVFNCPSGRGKPAVWWSSQAEKPAVWGNTSGHNSWSRVPGKGEPQREQTPEISREFSPNLHLSTDQAMGRRKPPETGGQPSERSSWNTAPRPWRARNSRVFLLTRVETLIIHRNWTECSSLMKFYVQTKAISKLYTHNHQNVGATQISFHWYTPRSNIWYVFNWFKKTLYKLGGNVLVMNIVPIINSLLPILNFKFNPICHRIWREK